MKKNRILLLRRNGGRPSIIGMYELPGGKLHDREQPVDALKRSLQMHSGIEPESFRLYDVISFMDPDDSDLQYLFILYEVEIADDARITMDHDYDHYVWRKISEIEPSSVTNSTNVLLNIGGINAIDKFANSKGLDFTNNNNKKTASLGDSTVIVHSDGGSRGNPGPTAAAYILENEMGETIDQGGEYMGDYLTNDVAEYYGVLLGLRAAARKGASRVNFYSDSLMVVDQLNGMFHVKDLDIKIYSEIEQLVTQFDHVVFRHIHREYNRSADGLVNEILDQNEPKRSDILSSKKFFSK